MFEFFPAAIPYRREITTPGEPMQKSDVFWTTLAATACLKLSVYTCLHVISRKQFHMIIVKKPVLGNVRGIDPCYQIYQTKNCTKLNST